MCGSRIGIRAFPAIEFGIIRVGDVVVLEKMVGFYPVPLDIDPPVAERVAAKNEMFAAAYGRSSPPADAVGKSYPAATFPVPPDSPLFDSPTSKGDLSRAAYGRRPPSSE